MKYILAIDSFKGCLTSAEAEAAVYEVLRQRCAGNDVVSLPMSDGGDGMLDAFVPATQARVETVIVHDAMMRPVEARYAVTDDNAAIIEVAQACGLTQIEPYLRNPLKATSYGVGELLAHAIRCGCHQFIVGLGGTACSDAGIGMLKGLVARLAPHDNIDMVRQKYLADCEFVLACDVRNPLYGPQGAAHVFAPQKGATPAMVTVLDKRAQQFAKYASCHCGYDCSCCQGAGAAGGLGYAFLQFMNSRFASGADLLLEKLNFDALLTPDTVVITGEGSADRQTLMGKLPERILVRAKAHGATVWLLAGSVKDTDELTKAGFDRVKAVTPAGMELADALQKNTAQENLCKAVEDLLQAGK